MKTRFLFLALAAVLSSAVFSVAAPARGQDALDATRLGADPIGRHIDYLVETGGRIGLDDAERLHTAGKFARGTADTLNFGLGANPVWLRFTLHNPTETPLVRRVSVETSWLDRIDIHVRPDGAPAFHHVAGDSLPFAAREIADRFFAVNQAFPPGMTAVYIRAESPDPLVLPVHVTDEPVADARHTVDTYSYGLLYGALFALLAYNGLLFLSLHRARYILYAVYLGLFIAMNAAYTGHGYALLWPDAVTWQLWSNPTLMLLYAVSGIAFATSFLETRSHFPRLDKALRGAVLVLAALAVGLWAGDRYSAYLLLAFVVALVFSIVMLALGITAVAAGHVPARYFLAASFIAMIGAAMTALSVAGEIPFNMWTYRTLDAGTVADAILLALALAHQFRIEEAEKFQALQMAKIDPLTRINNRRAFYDMAKPLWSSAVRNGRAIAVVVIDIDNFKTINDTFGHANGDKVLIDVARTLVRAARESDVPARWGGEEFILLLPETDLADAVNLAERLRVTLAERSIDTDKGPVRLTASAGVAQRDDRHRAVEDLIAAADIRMYQAKREGRNRVCADSPTGFASD